MRMCIRVYSFFVLLLILEKKLYCDIRFEKEEYSVFALLGLFGYFPHEHCSIQYNLLNKFILQNMNNIVEAFQTKKKYSNLYVTIYVAIL